MARLLVPFDEAITRYDPVFGLEIHIELNTATKMFCGCPTEFGAEPNTQTCPVCLALPGALPVVNAKAIESAIRMGLALNCEIAEWCRFARKNYFYPDMPKNFQTSQYDEPIAFDGYLDVDIQNTAGETETYRVEIERAHMEEDTGKCIQGADYSLVDYNRAGIPLIEIVTRTIEVPADKAPAVARAYVSHVRDLIGGLGVSDVRMDQGSLRADVNLSLKPAGSDSAPGRRQRTSTRSGPSSVPFGTRSPATQESSTQAARSPKRPATSTRTPARRRRAARSLMPTTTATSLSPTSPRSRRRVSGSSSCVARCPSRRPNAVRAFRPTGASPTSTCATRSAPARST